MSEEMIPLRKNMKKGLGRGLGSLLGETESRNENNVEVVDAVKPVDNIRTEAPTKDRVLKIGIEKLVANREQPRKTFDPAKIQELALSIKEKGIILPILVKAVEDGKYQIIAGERRWRAAQQAGLHEVPVLLRESIESDTLELALIENIQRQDLNPIEEAEAYGVLVHKYKLTQEQIAQKVSKERSTIANLMRLLSLAPEIKKYIRDGELSLGQAKVLMAVTDPIIQTTLAKKTIQQKLSVRALEKMVHNLQKKGVEEIELDKEIQDVKLLNPIIAEMQKNFGTKVDISPSGNGYKVAFYLYSMPELNQFIEKLRKTNR
jgi:ParB family transcriptional regulator, chromosome partitioning protein